MAETEWWTTPGEAARRLDILEAQWNALRNAAMGRGTQPLVGPQLAQRVDADWHAFRNWRDTLGGLMLLSSWADELGVWTRKANDARAAIAAAGQPVPAALTEWQEAAPAFITGTIGFAVAGVALVWALVMRRGK